MRHFHVRTITEKPSLPYRRPDPITRPFLAYGHVINEVAHRPTCCLFAAEFFTTIRCSSSTAIQFYPIRFPSLLPVLCTAVLFHPIHYAPIPSGRSCPIRGVPLRFHSFRPMLCFSFRPVLSVPASCPLVAELPDWLADSSRPEHG